MPNLRDFQVINEEVSTLLYEFGDHGLFETNRTFSNVSFFATSATGLPSPKDGIFPFMPIRCLDPLSWILWKLQIVELR